MDKCFECDSIGPLHNHHVVPKIKDGKRTIPLCEECHSKVHGKNFLNHGELTKLGLKKLKDSGFIKKKRDTPGLTPEIIRKGVEANSKKALENKNNIAATKRILNLREEGFIFQKIADKLNEEGFKSSMGKTFMTGNVYMLFDRAIKQRKNDN